MATAGLLENVGGYVFDEHKAVSYRWLSNELSISSDDAKRVLYEFVQKQERTERTLSATYLLAGRPKGGGLGHRVMIVAGADLAVAKKTLAVVTSVHVYSVQAGKPQPMQAVSRQLWAADNAQRVRLVAADTPLGAAFRAGSLNSIKTVQNLS